LLLEYILHLQLMTRLYTIIAIAIAIAIAIVMFYLLFFFDSFRDDMLTAPTRTHLIYYIFVLAYPEEELHALPGREDFLAFVHSVREDIRFLHRRRIQLSQQLKRLFQVFGTLPDALPVSLNFLQLWDGDQQLAGQNPAQTRRTRVLEELVGLRRAKRGAFLMKDERASWVG